MFTEFYSTFAFTHQDFYRLLHAPFRGCDAATLMKAHANKKEAMTTMATQTQPVTAALAPQANPAPRAAEIVALAPNPTAKEAKTTAEKPEVLEELVIEEVSIDGMCGVY